MKEYIRMLQAVWESFQTGNKPDYVGKFYHFTLMTPNFNPGPIASRVRRLASHWSATPWPAPQAKSRTASCPTAS